MTTNLSPPRVHFGPSSTHLFSTPTIPIIPPMNGGNSKIQMPQWFKEKNPLIRIAIGFLILGILAWIFHILFQKRIQQEKNISYSNWFMGLPIASVSNFTNKKEEDSEEEEEEEKEKEKEKENKKPNKKQIKLKKQEIQLEKPHPTEQGMRDKESFTQFRSSYGVKEIPMEYETCKQTNPDNPEKTCEFWKSLDDEARPVRKMKRVPVQEQPMLFNNDSFPASNSFGNFASVNF